MAFDYVRLKIKLFMLVCSFKVLHLAIAVSFWSHCLLAHHTSATLAFLILQKCQDSLLRAFALMTFPAWNIPSSTCVHLASTYI